jgi:hypothetical protein
MIRYFDEGLCDRNNSEHSGRILKRAGECDLAALTNARYRLLRGDGLLEIPELLEERSPPILRYFSDIAERGGAFRGHMLHDHGFDCGREISPDIDEFVADRFDHFSVCDVCHRDQTPRCVLARARRCSILPLELPTI